MNDDNKPFLTQHTNNNTQTQQIDNNRMTNITLDDFDPHKDNPTQMAHTPALGCSGLVDTGSTVIVKVKEDTKSNAKSVTSHIVQLSRYVHPVSKRVTIVGVHPKTAENIAVKALELNLLTKILNVKSMKREVTFGKSRFDVSGEDSNGQK